MKKNAMKITTATESSCEVVATIKITKINRKPHTPKTKEKNKNDENKTYRKFNAQPHKWLLNRHFFSV